VNQSVSGFVIVRIDMGEDRAWWSLNKLQLGSVLVRLAI
jgi:hypothetical protein